MDIAKFKNIPFRKRESCVVCGQKLNEPLIELPDFPITEIYTKKKIREKVGLIDQAFYFCEDCGHGQISNVIESEFIYGESYVTRTSTSPSAAAAMDLFLEFIDDNLKCRPIKNIVEIGCNDLYALKKLRMRADKLYGIDPILRGEEKRFSDEKIEAIGEMFENVDLRRIDGEIDVILSSHTLEHVPEPRRLIQRLVDRAASGTIFFFQFPSLEMLVKDARFDHVFHQHLNYFSLKSVSHMLKAVGAELVDCKINPFHWGALMIAFRKKDRNNINPYKGSAKFSGPVTDEKILKGYSIFKDWMAAAGEQLKSFKDEEIYGYGAALMLPVLDYHLKGLDNLNCIIDDDENKDGLYYINLPIQIKSKDAISDFKRGVFVITAINSLHTLRTIISKLIELRPKRIIIPINVI